MAASDPRKTERRATTSKAKTSNPKDIVGRAKVDITKVPMIALVHAADAMMDGATKYDAYNWRAKDIEAISYVAAAIRHLAAWLEGEECAPDSGVKHLGHAIATCAILLDAQAHGRLVDNRLTSDGGKALAAAMEQVMQNVAARSARRAAGGGRA